MTIYVTVSHKNAKLDYITVPVSRAAAGTRVPDGYPGNKLPG